MKYLKFVATIMGLLIWSFISFVALCSIIGGILFLSEEWVDIPKHLLKNFTNPLNTEQ